MRRHRGHALLNERFQRCLGQIARRAALLGQIRDALEKARRAVGVERVVFLAMHKSDLKSFEDYQNVYRDGALEAFPGAGRFREIRRAIADAEVLVTMKHHPVIFAVGEDTPVVSIAYSPYYVHKNFGAMQQYGVEACSTDMDSPDWPAQFDAALAKALDREWFAATVRARKEILKARKEAFMARIDAVVERSHA